MEMAKKIFTMTDHPLRLGEKGGDTAVWREDTVLNGIIGIENVIKLLEWLWTST